MCVCVCVCLCALVNLFTFESFCENLKMSENDGKLRTGLDQGSPHDGMGRFLDLDPESRF